MKKLIKTTLLIILLNAAILFPFSAYVAYREFMHQYVHFRTGVVVVVYKTEVKGNMEHIVCIRNNNDKDYMDQDFWYSEFIIDKQAYTFLSNKEGAEITIPEEYKPFSKKSKFPKAFKFSSR